MDLLLWSFWDYLAVFILWFVNWRSLSIFEKSTSLKYVMTFSSFGSTYVTATKGNPLINIVNTPTDGTQDKLLKVEYLKVRKQYKYRHECRKCSQINLEMIYWILLIIFKRQTKKGQNSPQHTITRNRKSRCISRRWKFCYTKKHYSALWNLPR